MNIADFQDLKAELSVKAKNGIDFILSAVIVWALIAAVWTFEIDAYNKSVLTFIVGGFMLPLALLMSKLFKTQWKIPDNPIQPLGLWLNFAQLFYFPFLIFMLIKMPSHFVMTYAIITGAHLFPYAWFYNQKVYAFMAGIISISSLVLGLALDVSEMFYLPLMVSVCLGVLALFLFVFSRQKV